MRFAVSLFCVFLALPWMSACGESDSSGGAASEVPQGFASLCEGLRVACERGATPGLLASTYSGDGTTRVSSNELWEAGESDSFVAQLDTSVSGKVSGVFDIGFEIEVEGATYLGEGESFTIYGTDVVEDEGCEMEARVVITGMRDAQSGDLEGELSLEFTENIAGEGCESEVLTSYPGSGAVFAYIASEVDCEANVAAVNAFVADPANQACEEDFDCVSETSRSCVDLEAQFCGQVPLSAKAEDSDRWNELQNGIRACGSRSCVVCDAALVPKCTNGLCHEG